MNNALLIDYTRCTGCRGCQVSCKEWNVLPAEPTKFFSGEGYQNPPQLSANSWNLVTFNEVESKNGDFSWIFGKKQCQHCLEPSCVAVCPVTAMEKSAKGPVTYDKDRCVGCRYCQVACPFDVPAFEWDKANPVISKCTLCFDRTEAGMETACSKTCPTDAIIYGEREDLVREAERRIAANPGEYLNHIYGRFEVGGTSVLHLSGVPFEELGMRTDLPKTAYISRSKPALDTVPYVMTGLGAVLGGVSWVVNRKLEKEKQGDKP